MSREEKDYYDREYNPRLRVSNHLTVMQGWRQKSIAARKNSLCAIDLRYGSGEGETIDVFYPASKNSPVFFFIHGGYWRGLDKSDYSFLAPPLVKAGACVVMPNYALAPAVTIKHIVDQTADALAWTAANAFRFDSSSERIFISGHSAGGHLAAMMLTEGRKSRSGIPLNSIVKGCLSISGLYDLKPLIHADFLKNELKLDEKQAEALSPVSHKPADSAPLWVCAGGEESPEFHRQKNDIINKWKSILAGDIPMPYSDHFSIVDEAANPQSVLFKAITSMLGL